MVNSFRFLQKVWSLLILPYWKSEEKLKAWGLSIAICGFVVFFVLLMIKLNYWNNEFYTALQEVNFKKFIYLIGIFAILSFIVIISFTIQHYLMQVLEISWRQWLTNQFVHHWTDNKSYYNMQLQKNGTDNPDQRIANDIHTFTAQTISLVIGVFKEILTVFCFFGVLWSLSGTIHIPIGQISIPIPGYMFWGGLIYAVVGTCVSIKLGRPLIGLNYEQEKREANFRYSLVRLRENVEGVALYHGEKHERTAFREGFKAITQNYYAIIKRMLFMNSWDRFYGQVEVIFPMLLAAPRFFAKQMTFGGLMQTLSAFGHIANSLSFFVNQYVNIASWKATTNRLLEFSEQIQQAQTNSLSSGIVREQSSTTQISLQNLSLHLPQGQLLFPNLNLTFIPHQSTLITGPTGIGKSTLLRALAGIWPCGNGKIKLPTKHSIMFLPQKPYMPLGTLRNAICYPTPSKLISDEELQHVLQASNLSSLSQSLDQVDDWSRVLSLGEQQKVSLARALIRNPLWLILDEATSALDENSEKLFYEMLKKVLPQTTLISVGHRSTLKAYHEREIALESLLTNEEQKKWRATA